MRPAFVGPVRQRSSRLPFGALLSLGRGGGRASGVRAVCWGSSRSPWCRSFLLLQLTEENGDLQLAAWGFAIYFAVMWCTAIRLLVKPQRISWTLLAQVVTMTSVLGVGFAIVI